MKTWLAIIITGLCISTPLLAQESEKPKTPQGTKIAVVNVGLVFSKYWKAKQQKTELEETLLPYKANAKRLADEAKMWEDALNSGGDLTPSQKDKTKEAIRKNCLELEDMSAKIQKDLGKKQEENLMILWKDLNDGITAVAKAQDLHIVLGYGVQNPFQSVCIKKQGLDHGYAVPLYIHESIDITEIMIYLMNSTEPRSRKKSPAN
jgi:Skp family chaperone for outer membrane proteins